jgi:DNA-binding response OmpR family regulator
MAKIGKLRDRGRRLQGDGLDAELQAAIDDIDAQGKRQRQAEDARYAHDLTDTLRRDLEYAAMARENLAAVLRGALDASGLVDAAKPINSDSHSTGSKASEHSSRQPRLRLAKSTRRASFDGVDLELSPSSFALLLALAEAVNGGIILVPTRTLEIQLGVSKTDGKPVGQAVNRLKRSIEKSGVPTKTSKLLIVNKRNNGYQLTLSKADVAIVE